MVSLKILIYWRQFFWLTILIEFERLKQLLYRELILSTILFYDAFIAHIKEKIHRMQHPGPFDNIVLFQLMWAQKAWGDKPREEYERLFAENRKQLEQTWLGGRYFFNPFLFRNLKRNVDINYLLEQTVPQVFTYLYFFYNFFKTCLVVFIISVFYITFTFYFFKLNFLKQLGVWFIVGFFFLWLISGFNFFLKRYRFGKFTSAIQRFWKRTNMCFWLIEGFLFLIFFYYYINSSQEPTYMYDTVTVTTDYLFSLTAYYFNMLFLVIVIFILYYVILQSAVLTYLQSLVFFLLLSFIIFYIFFIESYQVYYVLTAFREIIWVYDVEELVWRCELEAPRTRNKQQYLFMCLIAKYWHFLFIFISWVFCLMKSFEVKHFTYTLLALNLQNFIILFGLNLLFLSNWGRWLFRRYLDIVYFWFFLNTNLRWILYGVEEVELLCMTIYKF